MDEFEINLEQIYSLTVDNGKNMVKSVRELQKEVPDSGGFIPNGLVNDSDDDSDEEIIFDDEFADWDLGAIDTEEDQMDVDITDTQADINLEDIFKTLSNCVYSDNLNFDKHILQIIFCSAHTLQLVIKDALKKCVRALRLISKCRAIVKKLRSSSVKHIIKSRKLKKPIIDCVTRWSSIYFMVS